MYVMMKSIIKLILNEQSFPISRNSNSSLIKLVCANSK